MKRHLRNILICSALGAVTLCAQRGPDWTTSGANAQRTSSFPDTAISTGSMQKPGFRMLWKLKLNNQSRQMNALTGAVTAGTGYHYRGVNFLALMGGSSNNVFAVDYDMAQLYWEKHFDAPLPAASTPACPGGMTAGITRSVSLTQAQPVSRGPGAGVRSVSGKPGEGLPPDFRAAGRGGPAAGASGGRGRGGAAPGRGGGGGSAGLMAVYAVTSDGVLHTISFPSGKELQQPRPFVPANARLSDLAVVNDTAYTSSSNECGGVANGVWSMNLTGQSVSSWKTGGASPLGDLAFGTDGTVYAALGPGAGYGNSVVALEPVTLKLKDWFTATDAAFATGPVVIRGENRELIAAATKDGRVIVLDSQSLGGANHSTALVKSPASGVAAESLVSWEDANAVWLATSSAGTIDAMKIVTVNGVPQLTTAWTSREITSPLAPVVVNGVMFVASGGNAPAVLHALDASTGRELWNSGRLIASPMHAANLSASPGQIYLSTADSTFYAFGFPVERE